jgi:signal transduction histidine kinase
MGKARVAVARDLHDSIVQFLAGLGYRLEALIRSPSGEQTLAANLAELKDLVLTEQRQLRAFIRGLRTGKPATLAVFARDCASLCELLARQWDIGCSFASVGGAVNISLRTQLDVQQLIREAVANAVRHGRASHVQVSLDGEQDRLRLTVADDGRGFDEAGAEETVVAAPASLADRVRESRGVLDVSSTAEGTSLTIHLPLEDAA